MKKTKIKLWTGSIWEEVFPETDARVVHFGNNGTNLEQWHQTTDSAIQVLFSETNNAVSTAQQALQLAAGATGSTVFLEYESMYNSFKYDSPANLTVGQHVLIIKLNVPDLWISKVDSEFKFVDYTTDEDFLNELAEKGSVQVGRYHVSALETQKVVLSDYLEKVSTTTSYQQAYTKAPNGTQVMANISAGAVGSTLVQRAADGNIAVTYPNNDSSATSRAYVNEKFVAKQNPEFDSGATRGYVYFIDTDGNQVVKKVQIQAIESGTIPMRDGDYNFYVGDPTQATQCVNKRYVDNNFVAQVDYTNTPGLPGTDGYAHGRAYIVKYDGTEETVPICNQANNYSICWRDANANIYIGNVVYPSHAINKAYADEHYTAIYKHVITLQETIVGPSDVLKSMIIYSNKSTAYTSLTYEDMFNVISCYCEITATGSTQGTAMNTLRGFYNNGLQLHGQSSSTIGSVSYKSIVITNDTVTKM